MFFREEEKIVAQLLKITKQGKYYDNHISVLQTFTYVNQLYSYTNTSSTSEKITMSSCGLTTEDTYVWINKNCDDWVPIARNDDFVVNNQNLGTT